MKNKLKFAQQVPEAYKLLQQFDEVLESTAIEPLQKELIKIRAAQINGCAYCLNKHTAEAIKLGEQISRIAVLSAWREATNWFSEKDQVILQMTEEVTLIANHGLSETLTEKAISLFGELTTTQIIASIISINAWTRIGIAFHMQPQSAGITNQTVLNGVK